MDYQMEKKKIHHELLQGLGWVAVGEISWGTSLGSI